ncbi:hypothetical protein F4819DRAFT_350871 [Hypoxylon fuscum]|nr:hypothetical protein F4819DRAFT_350871 [Hypoxylon fuscum]
MVYSRTEEEFEEAWDRMNHEFEDQKPMLEYLTETYVPIRDQWANCYTSQYRNFGNRTTSPTESNNNSTKRLLETMGKTDLMRLYEELQRIVRKQLIDYERLAGELTLGVSHSSKRH